MRIELNKMPALRSLLHRHQAWPDECAGDCPCPFATIEDREQFNPADPSEAHYVCALLNTTVWGENPECNLKDWQKRAIEELEQAGD